MKAALLAAFALAACKYPSPFADDPAGDGGHRPDGSVDGPVVQDNGICGDGVVKEGHETCDDRNTMSGDGCSSSCAIEPGFACVGTSCTKTNCGDGAIEGFEACDDHNGTPLDGCSSCTIEPHCPAGVCEPTCGDGLVEAGEDCDDGNKTPGDGCSPLCRVETGYTCDAPALVETTAETLPMVVRDFKPRAAGGLDDFENLNGNCRGMVATALGADGFPVFQSVNCGSGAVSTAERFPQWWQNTDPAKLVTVPPLSLTHKNGMSFTYDSTTDSGVADGFFPIDGQGWGDSLMGMTAMHNFSFTTEARTWFTAEGGEALSFTGDDDVWVFVNGQLVIDLGGVHGAQSDSYGAPGLVQGDTVEISIFQAERHTIGSNYSVTLTGLHRARSRCTPVCGDGNKVPLEQCDDGNHTDGDGCSATCMRE